MFGLIRPSFSALKFLSQNIHCNSSPWLRVFLGRLDSHSLVLIHIKTSQPATAQFGVAGGKRQAGATNFQDLQEMAKKSAGGGGATGDTSKMQQMMQEALSNPDEYLSQLGLGGDEFRASMEQMMKMSPEEIQQQMEQAMKMMTEGDVVENILNNKDEVLASLEASGAVPPEELARYKADPNYFELKMRESFDQMGQLFKHPEYLEKTTEVMKNMAEMMTDSEKMEEMMKMVGSEFENDEKIEEARLDIISGKGGLAELKVMFETPEMKEILYDPLKWRETVKDGMTGLFPDGDGAKDEL